MTPRNPPISEQPSDFLLFVFVVLLSVAVYALYWFFRKRKFHKRPVKLKRLLVGNLLVLMFLISVILVSGEIYYRFFYDTTDSFGMTRVSRRWVKRYFHDNPAGFRDSVNYEKKKAAAKRRITILGDSFTAGYGVANVEDRFANRLRALRPEWEVHAIAWLGWDTAQHVDIVQQMAEDPGEKYEFDIVVLAYCLNDIADVVPQWRKIMRRIEGDGKPGFFVTHSFFLNTMHHRLRALRDPDISNYFQFLQQSYEGEVWDIQRRRLESLQSLIVGAGGRLVVVTFPFLHGMGPDYPFATVHDRLGEFWTKQGVPHLDLYPVYRDKTPEDLTINRFDAHPNEYAHQLAAAAINDFLSQVLRDVDR